MRKIPTVFLRNPEDMRYVTRHIHPDCAWVLAGEGVATRKYDGTCVMLDDGGQWWARREVKPNKKPPVNFVAVEHDDTTGKTVGWEPIGQSAFAKYHAQAVESHVERRAGVAAFSPGTYELCGPKVNGNPEDYMWHLLVRHDEAERLDAPRDFDALATFLADIEYEGIVWHHPDGRMAKLKRRDFPTDVNYNHISTTWMRDQLLDLRALVAPVESGND